MLRGESGEVSNTLEATPTTRMSALDICRGIAILAVLYIHVSGHFLPRLHTAKSLVPPSWEWYALAIPNSNAQWAVPCFLMLSALTNALSLGRSFDLKRYAQRRMVTALLPYLLWSGVYIAVNSLLAHGHYDAGPRHIIHLLRTGKAEFHLYFFVLVLELYVLLPLLVPLFRCRPPFWAAALGAIGLQAVVYFANRFLFYRQFDGTILWDILPVALGLWLFSQSERLEANLRKGAWVAGVVTLAMLMLYTPLAINVQLHQPANTGLYQMGQWGFTAGMSFLALSLAYALGRNSLTALLQYFGAESLAIYVMHPLAIIALDKIGLQKTFKVGFGFIVYYAACLLLPLLAAALWKGSKNRLDLRRKQRV